MRARAGAAEKVRAPAACAQERDLPLPVWRAEPYRHVRHEARRPRGHPWAAPADCHQRAGTGRSREHLPHLAQMMDKVTLGATACIITMKNHNSASYYALTGHAPPWMIFGCAIRWSCFRPTGRWWIICFPRQDEMPSFVAYPYVMHDGEVTPGQHASFLGKVMTRCWSPRIPTMKIPPARIEPARRICPSIACKTGARSSSLSIGNRGCWIIRPRRRARLLLRAGTGDARFVARAQGL